MAKPSFIKYVVSSLGLIVFATACSQSKNTTSPFYGRTGTQAGGNGTTTGTPGSGVVGASATNGTAATAQGSSGTLSLSVSKTNTSASVTGSYRSSKGVNVPIQFSQFSTTVSNTFTNQVGSEVSGIYVEAECANGGNNPCSVVLMSIYDVDYHATNGSQLSVNNFALASDSAGTRVQYIDPSFMYGYNYIDLIYVEGMYFQQ